MFFMLDILPIFFEMFIGLYRKKYICRYIGHITVIVRERILKFPIFYFVNEEMLFGKIQNCMYTYFEFSTSGFPIGDLFFSIRGHP